MATNRDPNNYLLFGGFWDLVKGDLQVEYKKRVDSGKMKKKLGRRPYNIRKRVFYKVVRAYLTYVFEAALEKVTGVKWYPGFGKIMISRISCYKFTPKFYSIKNKRVENVQLADGKSFSFFRWERAVSRLKYEIVVNKGWVKKLMKRLFVEKKEYLYLQPTEKMLKRNEIRKYYDIPTKIRSLSRVRKLQESTASM